MGRDGGVRGGQGGSSRGPLAQIIHTTGILQRCFAITPAACFRSLSLVRPLSLSLSGLVGTAVGCERHCVRLGLHGDVHQSVRVSVSWAKPYRVCQCECLSVCVLVSVSLMGKGRGEA